LIWDNYIILLISFFVTYIHVHCFKKISSGILKPLSIILYFFYRLNTSNCVTWDLNTWLSQPLVGFNNYDFKCIGSFYFFFIKVQFFIWKYGRNIYCMPPCLELLGYWFWRLASVFSIINKRYKVWISHRSTRHNLLWILVVKLSFCSQVEKIGALVLGIIWFFSKDPLVIKRFF
jgi:hypothetical protein